MNVLLVDDEQLVLDLVSEFLKRLGHGVTSFLAGEDAVAAFTADPSSFDFVVLDLTMPGLDGIEILRKLRDSGHRHPVILSTGLDPGGLSHDLSGCEPVVYLRKPFRLKALSDTIRDLMPA